MPTLPHSGNSPPSTTHLYLSKNNTNLPDHFDGFSGQYVLRRVEVEHHNDRYGSVVKFENARSQRGKVQLSETL
jgi:hypothetical protein